MSRKILILALSVVVISLVVYGASLASAATTNVHVVVTGGALSLASTADSTLTAVLLDGTDKSSTGNLGELTATDSRGTGAGWNVVVSSANFDDGAGHSIAAAGFNYTGITAPIVTDYGNAAPTAGAVTGALSGGGKKVLSAAVGDGMGTYRATPDLQLDVPAETYAGTYTAVVTETITTGP